MARSTQETPTVPEQPIPTNGSVPTGGREGSEAIAGTALGAMQGFNSFVTMSQRVGGELADNATRALQDGLETSVKVQDAVLNLTRDAVATFSVTTHQLESVNHLFDAAGRAVSDYLVRLIAAADATAGKVHDAVRTLGAEVERHAASVAR